MAGVQHHILDRCGHPVPQGVWGELYIGGEGVARGYRGLPRRTALAFVPDPFGATPGARLYATGDVARFLPDGTVALLGRRDGQLKVRGFRIEPGEIEAALGRHPGVDQAAVAVPPDQPGRLVAYVVRRAGASVEGITLRSFLGERLPAHMVPATYLFLPTLPRNAVGKVDRRALPAPTEVAADEGRRTPPRDATEKALAEVWQSVLGLTAVGLEDDFFALGGDSLLGLQVITGARRRGLALHPRQLFEHPTLGDLAAELAGESC
jgi:acyl-coenzyme A synthetase/AMP-(fatty) acid ligase/aryl carrier-like protein